MWTTRLKARGFALPTAIFILVILAALGAYAVKTSSTQNLALALDFQGARAYQAARAGTEWGVWQVTNNPAGYACSTGCTVNASCTPTPGAATSNVTLPGDLAAYAVTVACTCQAYCEGTRDSTNPLRIYSLTSTASQGAAGQPSYVARVISVTVQN
jgi:MSHA biogenesis protein MshP